MLSSALITLAVAMVSMTMVSAAPARRQTTITERIGWMSNDYLGGVLTKQTTGDASAGVLIGVSPTPSAGLGRANIFELSSYVDDSGETLYILAEGDTGNFLGVYETSASDDYAPGYGVLQTVSSQEDATYFTILPGADDGSWYIQPYGDANVQLSWYAYDDPTAAWIPVIEDATYNGSPSESWTWHTDETITYSD
ncbi:hypothetical protein CALCODRAFT_554571 [Calocera cornea HHB12733]|uniref:Uncharacterized protein n=1 Tax=Calocera cornea HHB12733 TaxID=1353952 RepID=A0A165H1K4_9BASI|nr:hypothetical protein CALCODRAFT_554571 [Calocera cornea HHB12733]